LGEEKGTTEYAIKQVGDRYYPVIVDREAGGHYELNNPLAGGVLSYKNPEAVERYIQRARDKTVGAVREPPCCGLQTALYIVLTHALPTTVWLVSEETLMYLENLF
jgi:hypothetical protein